VLHKFDFSIAYADTDAGGIVYHGRYIEIAERARMNFLHNVVIPAGDLGFVVRELSVKYLHPLRLGDDFSVLTETENIGAASMKLSQKFVKDDIVHAIIKINVAYLGGNMKPKRIPESILAAMGI